jgi:hypothetical protein
MRLLLWIVPAILVCADLLNAAPAATIDTVGIAVVDSEIYTGDSAQSSAAGIQLPDSMTPTTPRPDSSRIPGNITSSGPRARKNALWGGITINDRVVHDNFLIGKNNLLPSGSGLIAATNDFLFGKFAFRKRSDIGFMIDVRNIQNVWYPYFSNDSLLDSNRSLIERKLGIDSALVYSSYGYRHDDPDWYDRSPFSLSFVQENGLHFWLGEQSYEPMQAGLANPTVLRGYFNFRIDSRRMFGMNVHYINAQETSRYRYSLFTAAADPDSTQISFRKDAQIQTTCAVSNIGFDVNPSYSIQLKPFLWLYARVPFEYRRMTQKTMIDRTFYSLDTNLWHSYYDVTYSHYDSLQYFYAVIDSAESDTLPRIRENGWRSSVRCGLIKQEKRPYELKRLWTPFLGQMTDIEAYYSAFYQDRHKNMDYAYGISHSAGLSFTSLQKVCIPGKFITGIETFMRGSFDDFFNHAGNYAFVQASLIPSIVFRDLVYLSPIDIETVLFSSSYNHHWDFSSHSLHSIGFRYAQGDWGFSASAEISPYSRFIVNAWKSW